MCSSDLRIPMATAIRRFLSEAPLHPLQFTGKRWQSLIRHIVLWRNKYGNDSSIEVLKGLFGLRCTGESGYFYSYGDSLVKSNIPCTGFAKKWLFVGGEWEGVSLAGSNFRVPATFKRPNWPTTPEIGEHVAHLIRELKRSKPKFSSDLAKGDCLVGAGLWTISEETKG